MLCFYIVHVAASNPTLCATATWVSQRLLGSPRMAWSDVFDFGFLIYFSILTLLLQCKANVVKEDLIS